MTEASVAGAIREVTLDDKFDLSQRRIFLNGNQAVIRMLLMQKARDRAAGLNTGGFVSGYRGSPLGGLDQQLWRSKKLLAASDIVFQPGLNEELAATACWGTQQAELTGEGSTTASFRSGTARAPASTARRTSSAMPILRAPAAMAAPSR